jgi:hypothetical protein
MGVAMTVLKTRADVTMMYLIHDAFRRDLDRLEDGLHLLASMPAGPPRRALVSGLERCWADFDHFLHHHHTVEDERLWPILRKVCPMTGELLEDMEAEHAAVDPLVRECRSAIARALTSYPTFEDASRAADAVVIAGRCSFDTCRRAAWRTARTSRPRGDGCPALRRRSSRRAVGCVRATAA